MYIADIITDNAADTRHRTMGMPDYVLFPRHLAPYRDLAPLPAHYPICIFDDDGQPAARPLGDVVAELISSVDDDGDDGGRLRQALRSMEGRLRRQVEADGSGVLREYWDRNAGDVVAATSRGSAARTRLSEHLLAKRNALSPGMELLAFDATVPLRLLEHTCNARAGIGAGFRRDLEMLLSRLDEILIVAGGIQGNLARSTLNGEIDHARLVELVGRLPHTTSISDERRARVEALLNEIRAVAPVLLGEHVAGAGELWADEVLTSVPDARARAEQRIGAFTRFFASIHQAVLELDNRYLDDKHGPFFRKYTLSKDELAMCPPVLLHVDAAGMSSDDIGLLVDLLGTRSPVTVLVTVGRIYDETGDHPLRVVPAWGRLAGAALGLGSAYVAQTVQTNALSVWNALRSAVEFGGPSIVCVYTGADVDGGEIHPYLTVAAALESRAFPAFTYNPARGISWAEAFDVADNPSAETTWPVSEENDEELAGDAFTTAHFLLCDRTFSRHFTPIGESIPPDMLVPLAACLELDGASASGKLPIIIASTADGDTVRLAVSAAVMEATRETAAFWRRLQEMAGIGNSHVQRELDVLRRRLEEEKESALAEAEQRHQEELSRASGELADRIVGNIAAGLLNVRTAPQTVRTIPRAQPAVPAAEGDAVAEESLAIPEPHEEEDEELSFDEAYIETPRCTTCNECTTINGRMFAYNADKQAELVDLSAGTFRELVLAAEKCPVRIIHPGKPIDASEPGLEELIERATPFQ